MPHSPGGTKKGRTDSQNVPPVAPPPGLTQHCSQTGRRLQGTSYLLSLPPAAPHPGSLQATCPPAFSRQGGGWWRGSGGEYRGRGGVPGVGVKAGPSSWHLHSSPEKR